MKWAIFFCWLTVSLAQAQTPAPARLGINLAGPADWNTELPFSDVFRFSRPWISQQKGKSWGAGPPLELDSHGWVKSLAPDCSAETLLCTIPAPHFPSGNYTVRYSGKGRLSFPGGSAKIAQEGEGFAILAVDSSQGRFALRIEETDPADPIKDIQVFLPESSEKTPWRPGFETLWRGVACIRFMDFMMTNGSRIAHWEDRPQLSDATFAGNGVPLELLLDLSNRLHADAWLCIPHLADDDYVRKFATQVRDGLAPGLKAYIEYSNEIWNQSFPQHHYAAKRGMELKLATKPWEAAWLYNAKRSVEIFKIFEEVFSERERFVKVLGVQSGQIFMAEKMLTFQETANAVDVIASAPYLGFTAAGQVHPYHKLLAAEVATWSLERLFEHLQTVVLPSTSQAMRDNAALAKKYKLGFVAYEGGQHLVGVLGGENNKILTSFFHAANRDPRMGMLYTQYLEAWKAASGGLFCHFSSLSQWTKWGSWGLMEYYDENPLQQPKFRAVLEWAAQQGQKMETATSNYE